MRAEKWLLRELGAMHRARWQMLQPLLLAAIARRQPQVTVPGAEQHNQLLRQYIEAVWAGGWLQGQQEMAVSEVRRRARAEFADDPPGTPRGPKPAQAIEWAGRRLVLQGRWQRDLDEAVNRVLVHGLETGASQRDVMKALSAIFPTFGRARLENIARTEATSAYNQGRLALFRQNRLIAAVQFSSILDGRTTSICRARDGLVMRIDDPRLPGNTPPLHYQCRSVLVPVDRYDWQDLEAGVPDVQEKYFGWLPEGGPRTLEEALRAWDTAPVPQSGFGAVVDYAKEGSKGESSFSRKSGTSASASVAKDLIDERRVTIAPNVLRDSEPDVREKFSSIKKVEAVVIDRLSQMPSPLLKYWLDSDHGFLQIVPVVVENGVKNVKRPGFYSRRTGESQVALWSLEKDGYIEEESTHLIDHLLGSNGKKVDQTLSGGFAAKPSLASLAAELHSLFLNKDNHFSLYGESNPREFLAESVKTYLDSKSKKAMRDLAPELYSFFEDKWFSENFWKSVL